MKLSLKFPYLVGGLIFLLAACQGRTPTLPPLTPTSTLTMSPVPIASPTLSPEPRTTIPTATETPATLIPTVPPTATETPTPTQAPFTVSIWPSLGEPISAANDKPFTVQDGELFAAGLRQGQGWVSGGWPVPGSFYEEADSVYVSGYLKCFQATTAVSCVYGLGLQVGGGTQDQTIGTAGFIWSIEDCLLSEEPDLTLKFECVWVPDRGFGVPFEYIWLRAISGQGGQQQDVYITVLGLDWSGVVPTPTP